jgi:hypothetical protein
MTLAAGAESSKVHYKPLHHAGNCNEYRANTDQYVCNFACLYFPLSCLARQANFATVGPGQQVTDRSSPCTRRNSHTRCTSPPLCRPVLGFGDRPNASGPSTVRSCSRRSTRLWVWLSFSFWGCIGRWLRIYDLDLEAPASAEEPAFVLMHCLLGPALVVGQVELGTRWRCPRIAEI